MAKVNAVPFDKKQYWENRFEKEKHFEWLLTWDNIKMEIEPYLDKNEDVLHLGNENSPLLNTNQSIGINLRKKDVEIQGLHLT